VTFEDLNVEPAIDAISRNISVLATRAHKEQARVSTIRTDIRRLNLDPKELQERFGGVSLEVVSNTLKNTTQHAFRDGTMPMARRYKTSMQQLRYRRLKDTWYSDTMKSAVKSLQGNLYNQLFVNDKGWEYSYPMKLKSDAPDALKSAFKKFGLPEIMVTDNAPELVKGEWGKMLKVHYVEAKTTEPHSPWQNRAEAGIREHKKATRRHMNRRRCPLPFWDYCSEYTSDMRSSLSLASNPGGRSGKEIIPAFRLVPTSTLL
jgi:hypothetical protein